MRDVIFVLLTVAFFALTAGYIRACAAVAGLDEHSPKVLTNGDEVAAEVTR